MTPLQKLEYLRTLQNGPLTGLAFRAANNSEELPVWLMNILTPDLRQLFPALLKKAERSLKDTAEEDLKLLINKTEAELKALRERLKELKNGEKDAS